MPELETSFSRREYRPALFRSMMSFISGIVMLLVGGAIVFASTQSGDTTAAFFIGLVCVVLACFFLLSGIRARLILEGSRIEVRSSLRTRTADRSEIEGTRRMRSRSGQWTQVYLRENRGSFKVPDSFQGRDDFQQWLTGVPDLDEAAAAEITRHLESQSSPGENGADARDKIAQAKKVVISLSAVEVLAAIAVVARYAPVYQAATVLLLLIPPAGIYLLLSNPLLYTIFKRRPDPRVGVGFLVLLPGFLFFPFFKADQGAPEFLNLTPLFQVGLLVFILYLAPLARSAWKSPTRLGSILALILCGAFYASGVARVADTLPDHSVASQYPSEVHGMHKVSGKSTSYYLTLGEWGPRNYSGDVEVSPLFYEQTQTGDSVCLSLHSGFLHAPWYTLARCPAPVDPSAH